MLLGTLDRVASPDLATFESYARRGQPFVMTNVVEDWPARQWTVDSIAQRCADNDVVWEQYPDDRSRLGWWNLKHGKFSEYMQRMRNNEAVYVAGPEMGINFPQLMADCRQFSFVSPERKNEIADYRLFFGREQRTEIHYHPGVQSILIHVAGKPRKLALYPPSETSKLYPFRWYEQVQMSRVLPNKLDAFPKFKQAKHYEYELQVGEALFIPVHWWHWVQSYGETVAIAQFFGRRKGDKFDFRLELRDRASASGERVLRHTPRLAKTWKKITEFSAWGS